MQPALGNQAVGSLLAGGPAGGRRPGSDLSLLGADIPPPRVVRHGATVAVTVYFGQNLFLLDQRNLGAVQALAEELRLMSEPTIAVEGHASTEGDRADNQALSERRRDAVIAVLGHDREPRPAFGGRGHGEDDPAVAETGTGEALEGLRAQNRRVEVVVVPRLAVSSGEPVTRRPSLRLTDEQLRELLPPETPEERLNRILREPPPEPAERRRRSLVDLTNEKLDEVLDRVLRGVGIEDRGLRDRIRPRLRDAIKSGASRAVETAVDSANLDPEASEALKKALEAAANQEF